MVDGIRNGNDWPAMPPEAEQGYQLYASVASRNATEVDRLLSVPPGTVASWSHRYRWPQRVASDDVSERDANIAAGRAAFAKIVPTAVAKVKTIIAGEYADPRRAAVELRAAFGSLDRHGISPIQQATLEVTHRESALPVSTEELARLVAAGDITTLLALAAGRPLPEDAAIETTAREVVPSAAPRPEQPPTPGL